MDRHQMPLRTEESAADLSETYGRKRTWHFVAVSAQQGRTHPPVYYFSILPLLHMDGHALPNPVDREKKQEGMNRRTAEWSS